MVTVSRWSRIAGQARYVASSPADALTLLGAAVENRAWRALEKRVPGTGVECAVCGWKGRRFEAFLERHFVVRGSQCPGCGCQSRHRALLGILLEEARNRPGARMLDVAPSPGYAARLRAAGVTYVGMDVGKHRNVDVLMDLCRLALPDASMDIILCSHVLEHVPADLEALGELDRVLRPGGVAFLDVPRRSSGLTHPISPPDHQGHVWDYGEDVLARFSLPQWVVTEEPYGPDAPLERFFRVVKGSQASAVRGIW